MFKEKFIKLCADRGESPSSVCKKIGITSAAFSQWTDQTVPRITTQIKAADYFGVDVDYFKDVSTPTIDSVVSAAVTASRSPEVPFIKIAPENIRTYKNNKRAQVGKRQFFVAPKKRRTHPAKYGAVLSLDKEKTVSDEIETLQKQIIDLIYDQKDEQKLESIKMMLQALK